MMRKTTADTGMPGELWPASRAFPQPSRLRSQNWGGGESPQRKCNDCATDRKNRVSSAGFCSDYPRRMHPARPFLEMEDRLMFWIGFMVGAVAWTHGLTAETAARVALEMEGETE